MFSAGAKQNSKIVYTLLLCILGTAAVMDFEKDLVLGRHFLIGTVEVIFYNSIDKSVNDYSLFGLPEEKDSTLYHHKARS